MLKQYSTVFKTIIWQILLNLAERKKNKMKILVITASPRRNGNSNTLADNFIKGAKQIGHNVVRFDSAFKLLRLEGLRAGYSVRSLDRRLG